jgi:hypothetical protein
MKKHDIEWTHKGWLLMCPIYISEIDTDCPVIMERWDILSSWLWVNEQLSMALIGLLSLMNPDYEPAFVIRVTGELP